MLRQPLQCLFAVLGVASVIVLLAGGRAVRAAEDLGEPVTESVDGNPIVAGTKPFRDVAFSPDGKLIATTAGNSQNGTREFAIWDATSREKKFAYQAKQAPRTLSFSTDGKQLTVGIFGGKVTTLNTADGKIALARDTPDKQSDRMEISRDGKLLAISNRKDFAISLWDAATLESRGVLKGHEKYVQSLAFSPDNKLLVSCGSDHRAILWDIAKGTVIRSLDTGDRSAASVAFSADGKHVAVASNDLNVRVFVTETGEEYAKFPMVDGIPPTKVLFSPDGKLLAIAGSRPNVYFYRLEKNTVKAEDVQRAKELIHQLDDDRYAVREQATIQLARLGVAVASVLNEAVAKAASDEVRRRLQSILGRLEAPKPFRYLSGHRDVVEALAFSPDGKQIATASRDASVRIWIVKSGESVGTIVEQ